VELYFAYGSNMSRARLAARVPGARPLGRARLPGGRVLFNKRGRDGSGKANLVEHPGAEAWGVAWRVATRHLPLLDRYEPGYLRLSRPVELDDGLVHTAHVYVWHGHGPELSPFDWYLEHLLVGAREHALPRVVLEALAAVPLRRAALPEDDRL